MSFSHMILLGIIALVVIPPEKLPEFARQVARFVADLRRSTSGIWDDLKQDAAFKPEDLLKPEDMAAKLKEKLAQNESQNKDKKDIT